MHSEPPTEGGGTTGSQTMSRILIAYGTTEGQSRKIAEHMAIAIRATGWEVDLLDVSKSGATAVQRVYSGVILGGSVHAGRHLAALVRFVERHAEWLETIPVGFFSVSLTAVKGDEVSRREARRMLNDFLDETGLEPSRTCLLAGALRYSRYGLLKRWMMRRIASREGGGTDTSRDYEYTDWDAAGRFASEFTRQVAARSRQAA